MTAHRARSRSRPSDMSAEQKKIHDLLNGGDGVLVLRQSHRPAGNDAFASHRDAGRVADLLARQSAAFSDLLPCRVAQMPDERFVAGGELFDEGAIEN